MISGRFERKKPALEPLFCGANRSGVSSIQCGRKRKIARSGVCFPSPSGKEGQENDLWVCPCQQPGSE
jgi:hypothetical protein